MLWDLTWAYVAKYGYDNNKYTGTGGNNRVMRLVLDGLKLQPCNPSFTEARDALIAADQATTGGADYCMIWEVFARRGLGINASSGNRNDSADQVEDFTQPAPGPNCTALGTAIFENNLTYRVYPNPATNEVFVELPNYNRALDVRLIDIHGRLVYQDQWSNGTLNRIPLGNIQSGIYILQATGESLQITEKIIKN
jgi:extracellular elastinolytic metalloproteinase